MEILKPAEVKSIEQFFQLKQDSLLKVMNRYLKTKYETVHTTKEYIVAVGDIPVALVAHLDTVFPTPPEDIFYDREKNVMWSPDGLGADDRAGVYSIVQILKTGLKPTVIFTTDEEQGALGAMALIKDFPEAPVELKYIIELDRRGSNDCVFYDCNNLEFEEYVESFGFVSAWGTFSDISVICPAWGMAGVNLSIGYRDEHSYSELLYIGQMKATIKKVIKMLEDDDAKMFEYIPYEYGSRFKRLYDYDYDCFGWDEAYGISKEDWNAWHTTTESLIPCKICQKKEYEYNLFPTKGLDGSTIFLCPDCIAEQPNVCWCNVCKEPYVKDSEDEVTDCCYDCRGKENTDGNK